MRFAPTEEQRALRETVGELLARRCGAEVVRAAWSAPIGALERGPWQELAGMGALEVLISEADGGLGLDWSALVGVLEETGRRALPHPFLETAAVAAPLLGRRLVDLVAAGRSMGSISLAGSPAPCGADADWLVVADESGAAFVERAAATGEAVPALDGARRLWHLTGYDRAGAIRLADGPGALGAARDRAALGAAAQLLGLSATMLDMTVAYVGTRRQFGVPVGSFQAVKHQLAEALKELSFARPVVYAAAWALSAGRDELPRQVSAAKAMASEAAELVGRAALQCHGAMGYTVEYDLHLFLKRAWALQRSFGDAAWHRRRIAASLGL